MTAGTGSYGAHETARFVVEPVDPGGAADRGPFSRDRARVLHSAALRRLAGKTQVVGVAEDAFPRTRLTHSLETAQVGRELAAALGADPDLVDAACLAHDLGHPPFGHNGEAALAEAGRSIGGFEGNAQSLRLLTRLEVKVAGPDGASAGLNLTRATLDAATKYPWPRREGTTKFGVYAADRAVFDWLREGAPEQRRCLEAQVMDWSDDVAYSVHDVEDGLHAGHVDTAALDDPDERAELVALAALEHPGSGLADVLADLLDDPRWPRGFDHSRGAQVALKAWTSATIARFCGTAQDATRAVHGPAALRRYDADLVVPDRARAECALLKAVVVRHVMALPHAVSRQGIERTVLLELVAELFRRGPDALDSLARQSWAEATDDAGRLRVVLDQVAGLTDASAHAWHDRLCA